MSTSSLCLHCHHVSIEKIWRRSIDKEIQSKTNLSGKSNDGDDDLLTCRKDSFLFVREGREGVRRHHEPFSGVGDSTWSSLMFIVHVDVFYEAESAIYDFFQGRPGLPCRRTGVIW